MPSFDCCPIIEVEYVVEVSQGVLLSSKISSQKRISKLSIQVEFESTGSINSDIDTKLPIIIGTVPVLRSAPRDDISSSSTTQPSAPPLEMEGPPGYSTGNSASE